MIKLMGLLKNILHFLVIRPFLLTGLAVIMLCLLLWFGGEYVGLTNPESRQIVIICVILAWLLFGLFEWIRAFKNSQKIEKTLYDQSHTQALRAIDEKKENIELLQRQFDKALGMLKKSNMKGGFFGNTALSTLPWYMFIGPPASGKSTALVDSGLEFPCLTENRRGIQGIGGTRNCDWWFTNQGVLLDTAGRYVMEEEDQEWTAFLQMLKNGRKPYALNGVMVAVSLMDVTNWSEQDFERHVSQIRRRLDELILTLGIIFPVYVVFTKCDLLKGFLPFFSDLTKSEREQIWGSTLEWDQKKDSSPAAFFEEEFDGLVKRLITQRQRTLVQTPNSTQAAQILQFPLQFASSKEKLNRFVDVLFHPSRYQDNPRFRGFYFMSGTQVGHPIDRILASITQASGLALSEKKVEQETGPTKSFFIKDFFTRVVFPDQNLTYPTSRRFRRQGALRIAAFMAGSVLIGLVTFGLASSYGVNVVTLGSIKESIKTLKEFPTYTSHAKKLNALEGVRSQLASIETIQKEGLPLHLRGGLQRA